jgi:hypothetical protein
MLAPVGHNQPPGPIDDARNVMGDLSRFLAAVPVIENDDQAQQAKLHVDRVRSSCGALEAERASRVKPLNDQLADINAEYKAIHNTDQKRPGTLDKLFNELRARLTAFVEIEERRRQEEAESARLAAQDAERIAREAEAKEREAIQDAKVGEATDIGAATLEADEAFSRFGKLDREAQRAERETNVRISGGFSGRALSLRSSETLVLESYSKAITAIGQNPKIEAAILSAARDYRKKKGTLPAGVVAVTERKI